MIPIQFIPGSPVEIGIILLIVVLLFGANKIPKLAQSTGEAMGKFKKGRQEVEEELKNTGETELNTNDSADSANVSEVDDQLDENDIETSDDDTTANN